MSINTPEALRLADELYLTAYSLPGCNSIGEPENVCIYAASELRRLHEENKRLRQLVAYQGMDDTAAQLLATNSGSDSKQ